MKPLQALLTPADLDLAEPSTLANSADAVDPTALLLPLVGHAIHRLNSKISKLVLKRPFGLVSCVPVAVLPGSVNEKPAAPKKEEDSQKKKGKKTGETDDKNNFNRNFDNMKEFASK